jgi:hypothetical protein
MTDFLSKVIDWDIDGKPLLTMEQAIQRQLGDIALTYVQAAIKHTQDNYVASLSTDDLLRKNAYLANCVRFLIDGCQVPTRANESLYNWDQNRGKTP